MARLGPLRMFVTTLVMLGSVGSCAAPRPASEAEIEREITRIDVGAPGLRQVTRRASSGGRRLDVTGYLEGRDLVRVDDTLVGSDGATLRSRYYFWRGRLVGIDVDGVMLNRPSPGRVESSTFQWHYLFRPDGRMLTGRVTIDGHPMPPSQETVRAARMKSRAYQERFAHL